MSEVGAIGVGLSVAFAGFMVVLGVEVYLIWKSRKRRRRVEAAVPVADCRMEQRAVAMEGGRGLGVVEKAVKEWLRGRQWRKRRAAENCSREAAPPMGRGLSVAECGLAVYGGETETGEEEDIFNLGGLLGPPRLLFTITEETSEEMDMEETRYRAGGGRGSRRASRASSEIVFVPSSGTTSPFVTPPSSPPFATPMGSPPTAAPHAPAPPPKPLHMFVDDSSSSSSSSFDTVTPPFATSPHNARRPLSSLFEETSSTTSSSSSSTNSSSATPAALSPPHLSAALTSSPKRLRRPPLSLLLDPPPSPSSALLHQHRVHPAPSSPSFLLHLPDSASAYPLFKPDSFSPSSPFRPVPHLPGMNIEGTPILASSPAFRNHESSGSFSKFLLPRSSAPLTPCSPASNSGPQFSSTSSPLSSALSSPFRMLPSKLPPDLPSCHFGGTDRIANGMNSSTVGDDCNGSEA